MHKTSVKIAYQAETMKAGEEDKECQGCGWDKQRHQGSVISLASTVTFEQRLKEVKKRVKQILGEGGFQTGGIASAKVQTWEYLLGRVRKPLWSRECG